MTIKQKQHLLGYLGYYEGDIDDNFGPMSKLATASFQDDYGLETDGIFGPLTEAKILEAIAGTAKPVEPEQSAEPENFWDGIKHFDREEFRCNCEGKYCDGFQAEPSKKLVKLADRIREHYGVPMIVSSGVRCKTHNANVHGDMNSRHMRGLAMDFCIKGKPAAEVLEYVWKQPEVRYAYAIDSNYVHMDVDV